MEGRHNVAIHINTPESITLPPGAHTWVNPVSKTSTYRLSDVLITDISYKVVTIDDVTEEEEVPVWYSLYPFAFTHGFCTWLYEFAFGKPDIQVVFLSFVVRKSPEAA